MLSKSINTLLQSFLLFKNRPYFLMTHTVNAQSDPPGPGAAFTLLLMRTINQQSVRRNTSQQPQTYYTVLFNNGTCDYNINTITCFRSFLILYRHPQTQANLHWMIPGVHLSTLWIMRNQTLRWTTKVATNPQTKESIISLGHLSKG